MEESFFRVFGVTNKIDFIWIIVKYLLVGGFAGWVGTYILGWRKSIWDKNNKELEVRLTKQLEKLNKDSEIELTKQLEKLNKEHEVVFTKYHEKQSIVLAELFSKMVKVERIVQIYLMKSHSGNGNDFEELEKDTLKIIADFADFYMENEIFLSNKISIMLETIKTIIEETFGAAWPHNPFIRFQYFESGDNRSYIQMSDIVKEAWDKSKVEFPKLRQELKDEIKIILSGKVI